MLDREEGQLRGLRVPEHSPSSSRCGQACRSRSRIAETLESGSSRRRPMKLPIAQLGVLLVSANPIFAQYSAADFAGTWELVSYEARTEVGEWAPAPLPITGEPVGIIMYDDKGNMAVQITGNPRSQRARPTTSTG